ncbi:LysE family translocator [Flavimaricola marinus]|uniref:Homoserine/homoserine lactone efflux protein n=1 Tax=Flavimaricola marinus TaxID=1819565 RepID=A0A238LBC1_9RHOB|nr:LysE family transporter [Flavimaricola marinus]SMY06705.1 Homoserine/homoserine lactone efflux protein [Flavimaricola marinus]
MIALDSYLIYLATVLIFFAHPPGPSQLLFVGSALRQGLRPSLPVMAGDLSANALQICAAGFGLAGLIALSAGAFGAIKWLGIAYLVWIGVNMIRSASHPAPRGAPTAAASFRRGFLTSAANPYAVVFFAALFPQFIDPALTIAPQVAILGATYLIIDGVILLAMGAAATRLVALLGGWAERWLGIGAGIGLLLAALGLALRGDALTGASK